ncbi:hypothetical protein KW791_01895 [Candidatus Parcubacteria bacterium]|nr:hypothetical protein [Candidatus Parcubacteria bacterium]
MKSLILLPSLLFAGFALAIETPTPTADSGGQAPISTPAATAISATPAATSVVRTQAPTATVTVPPKPTATLRPLPSPTPTPQPSVSVQPITTTEPEGDSSVPYVVAGSLIALALAAIGYQNQKSNQNKDKDRCGNVRELLEQKKREMKDMLKSLPSDKAKEFAKEAALGQVKKNDDLRKVLEKVEGAKEKYDKLKETIELLEKKYNLCMLELPKGESLNYKGTIIQNSLTDPSVIKSLKVEKSYKIEDWNLHDVMVGEDQIKQLGKNLNDGPWYMHFWEEGKDDVTVVFKDKIFKIKYSDKNTWKEAISYGKSKGIPEKQLDFSMR